MLSFSGSLRVFVAVEACDMRKGFERLSALVGSVLKEEVKSGALFAAPGLLAQIIVSKFCDHLPLYRQQSIFRTRYRVHLLRQSMARWMGLAADWLRPINEEIRTGVMAGGYLQIDETPIRYLSPGHGQTKLGYFWTVLSPGGDVLYHWETSRAADCLKNVIAADFAGTLQCDAYLAYGSFVKKHPRYIKLAGCWAHARRNFYEAREQAPQRCGWILRQIAHLYRIEEDLRRSQTGPRKRAAVRSSQSRLICQRLYRALLLFKKSHRYLPRSTFGQAIDYALSNWSLLGLYLEDGRLELDNNLVENAIRPTAVGKKNWLFLGDAEAGQRSAILYTIIESCRCRGIDPYAYLRERVHQASFNDQLAGQRHYSRGVGENAPLLCNGNRGLALP
jgi:transposase